MIGDTLKTEQVKLDSIALDPSNVRKHDARNLESIKASLMRFGQQKPVVVDRHNLVIAGNGTVTAARALGWSHIDVVRTELTGVEATAYAIADNRTAELAEWDDDALTEQLVALQNDESIDVEVTGWTDDEIEALVDSLHLEGDDDEAVEVNVPEPPADPVTRPGDMWILGRHRLLCGDSTDIQNWKRLKIPSKTVCFTSPPYNLGKSVLLRGNTHIGDNAYDDYDDNVNPEQWRQLCDGMLSNSLKYCEVSVFNIQSLANNKFELLKWVSGRDEYRDVLVWDKGHAAPAIAQGVTTSAFEFLFVFGQGNNSRRVPLSTWRGTVSNVYRGGGQRSNDYSGVHAATFPVHLPYFVCGELCDESKSVVDCCCGTGTTLMAADQLEKACYGLEISPAYCDVIVERWQQATGGKAQRAGA